jgi:hypothetical protein
MRILAHSLHALLELPPPAGIVKLQVDFEDGFETQLRKAAERIASLTGPWIVKSVSGDSERLQWQERGSQDRLATLLSGCLQHGWPFVIYVDARAQDEPTDWLTDYERTYLGWWGNKRSFALEVASSDSNFLDEAEQLDNELIDEICSGFLCLEIDSQVLIFDLML